MQFHYWYSITKVKRISIGNTKVDCIEVSLTRADFVEALINLDTRIEAHNIPVPYSSIGVKLNLPCLMPTAPINHSKLILGKTNDSLSDVD